MVSHSGYRHEKQYSRSIVVLDDASEEEAEDLFPDSGNKAAASNRESKKEREEKLKQMMEDDDDDADGTINSCVVRPAMAHGVLDEEMPDADEEPEREPTPVEQPPPSKPAELKEEVTVQGGRRRGKRQVMKKRTIKDEEGYLGEYYRVLVSGYTNQDSHSRGTHLGVILRR